VCDFLHTLRRDATPAQHVGEKRSHVGESLGSAEGDDEDGVKRQPNP
jgi:hypothetical protein